MRVLTDMAPEGCPQVSLAPQRLLFITCTLEQGLSLVRGAAAMQQWARWLGRLARVTDCLVENHVFSFRVWVTPRGRHPSPLPAVSSDFKPFCCAI